MHMGESFPLAHPQPVEKGENHEGGQPLGRRRKVEEAGAADSRGERRAPLRPVIRQIQRADGRAAGGEVCGDLAGEGAAIEIIRSLRPQTAQGGAQRGQFHQGAFGGRLPLHQKTGRKARRVDQFRPFGCGQLMLAGGDGKAMFRRPDRVLHQPRQGPFPPQFAAELQRLAPA